MFKKHGVIVSFAVMLLMCMFIKNDIHAANVVDSRTEGDITWTLYDDGLLDISGTGELNGNNCSYKDYKSKIKKAVIEKGITSLINSFIGFSELRSVSIANSVISIGYEAFENCDQLNNIEIPNSVTTIGNWAFYRCKNLQNITIPSSVTGIGYTAFGYCDNLTSLTIPDSVTTIESYAFCYCSNLESVTIPAVFSDRTDDIFIGTPWALKILGPYNGSAGDLLYYLDKNGTLTLSGSGKLTIDYNSTLYNYKKVVKTVAISEGVSSLDLGYSNWESFFENIKRIDNNSSSRIRIPEDYYKDYSWCDINNQSERIFWLSKGTALRVNKKLDKHIRVIFDSNGASGKMNPINIVVGQDNALPMCTFTKKGYRLSDWTYQRYPGAYINYCSDGGTIYISTYDVSDHDIDSIILTANWQGGKSKKINTVYIRMGNTSYIKGKATLDRKNIKSVQLFSVVYPTNANQDVTWSSSNKKVATISKNGLLKLVGKGKTTITCKAVNGKKATLTLTVKSPINVKSVKLKKQASLKVKKSITLTAAINPTNAANKKVTWESTKPEVAEITKLNGLKCTIKGKSKGTTYIKVTTIDCNKTSKCKITVR
ncbi:MAG: leucine-rich repeat protein [Lachnospiraceae bacterium]|nr:leucine-rich repeat protein [Lachnospiraceae bacterium]